MALRGGPYRSSSAATARPGWRPEDFLRLQTHFFVGGVVQGVGGDLAVTQRAAGANLSVDVAAGLAMIPVTTTLLNPNETINTWLFSDAVTNVLIAAADPTNPRKDRIVAKFDTSVDPNGMASNIVSITVVQGTPAGSPSAPATPSNAKSLAIVIVAAGATSITNANILDDRTYVTLNTSVLADVVRTSKLSSNSNGLGASMIGIEDPTGIITATTVETALAEIRNAIPAVQQAGIFGDGSDGTYTLDGTQATVSGLFTKIDSTHYRLDRCAYFNNLTISNGVSLNTNGYILFAKGTLTLGGGDNVISPGGAGGAGVSVTGSGTGGAGGTAGAAAHTGGVLKDSLAGKAGASGTNAGAGSGTAGTAGFNESPGNGSTGAAGGYGGTPNTGPAAGGAGGTVTAPTTAQSLAENFLQSIGATNAHSMGYHGGSGSGGGGKGGGADGGSGGGGSGANGGNMLVYAYKIAGSGNIKAAGGNGGNGGNGTIAGGGGGGGGGGSVTIFTGDTVSWSGTASAPGGTGGTAGSSGSGMTNGGNGSTGFTATYKVKG